MRDRRTPRSEKYGGAMTKSQRSISIGIHTVVAIFSVCLGVLASTAVLAQSAPSPAQTTDKLEEIVVTAQRRAENLQIVPMSVSVLTEAKLEVNGVKDLGDLLQTVPGIEFNNTVPGQATISMRGVSANSGAATVSILMDDIPLPGGGAGSGTSGPDNFGAPNPQIFDIDRVEVLRGPQGTLFGVSSMGGAIRFVTAQPQLNRFEGSVGGELGWTPVGAGPNYDSSFIANIPLIADSVATRVGVSAGHLGGYVDRLNDAGTTRVRNTDSIDHLAARLTTLIRLSDTFTITPLLLYQKNHIDDVPYFESSLPRYQKYSNFPENQDDVLKLGALTIKKDFRFAELSSITSYVDRALTQRDDYGTFIYGILSGILTGIDPSYAPLAVPYLTSINIPNVYFTDSINYSEEIRLTSTDKQSRFQWLVGAFANHLRYSYTQTIVAPGFDAVGNKYLTPVFGSNPFDSTDDTPFEANNGLRVNQYAAFADLNYGITSQLRVSAGVRWYSEKQLVTRFSGGLFDAGPGIFMQAPDIESSDTGFNPRYTIDYQVTPSNLLYASAAKGFRAGGGNGSIPNNPQCNADTAGYTAATGKSLTQNYLPDYVWSYEIGSKNMLASDRVMLNASLFYLQWQGIQEFLTLDNYGNQVCGFGFIANVGQAVSRGGELELQARVTEGLTVGLSGSYTNAHITSPSDQGAPQGAQLPYVPQLGGDVNLTYVHPLAGGSKLTFNANENFTGNQVRDFVPDSGVHEQRHFAVTNLRLGLQLNSWEVSLFARNLFNAQPILNDTMAFTPGPAAAAVGIAPYNSQTSLRPRSVGVGAKMTF
jgi:iron complex outermembrane receptor protein